MTTDERYAHTLARLKRLALYFGGRSARASTPYRVAYWRGAAQACAETALWLRRIEHTRTRERQIAAAARDARHPAYNLTLDGAHYGYNAALKIMAPLLCALAVLVAEDAAERTAS